MSGYERRSKEGPMDFQYTNETREISPAWSPFRDTLIPKKRPYNDSTPSFPEPHGSTPVFGRLSTQNIPFLFHTPPPSNPNPLPHWQPPPSTETADIADVSMQDPGNSPVTEARTMAIGAVKRVYLARQKQRKERSQTPRHTHEDSGDSDNVEEQNATLTNNYTLHMPSPVLNHSDVPYLLLGYLQFFFNLSFALLALYLVIQFILTVQRDVEYKVAEYSLEILQEIATCTSLYQMNRCSDMQIPGTAKMCADYESCMARDPSVVGRARVGAEMIGEVVNSFIEPISWKALAFGLAFLSFFIVFMNSLLTLYRTRHTSPQPHPPPASMFHPPPGAGYPHTLPAAAYYIQPQADWKRSRSEQPSTPARKRRLLSGVVNE